MWYQLLWGSPPSTCVRTIAKQQPETAVGKQSWIYGSDQGNKYMESSLLAFAIDFSDVRKTSFCLHWSQSWGSCMASFGMHRVEDLSFGLVVVSRIDLEIQGNCIDLHRQAVPVNGIV
ncbi:hypothetical protein WISP_125136 [Willisornis vidua]|uniref:Uncharacterized protein n=1 Tax=Willisornis vidua TaxID=1566151 RepID=A0ABQ9CX76_9PASS|nr:hypothetical protein WISP_125136 [Willisornis vidua]